MGSRARGTPRPIALIINEDKLREAIQADIERRGLSEAEYPPAERIAADFPDTGMEEELLLGIVRY